MKKQPTHWHNEQNDCIVIYKRRAYWHVIGEPETTRWRESKADFMGRFPLIAALRLTGDYRGNLTPVDECECGDKGVHSA